MNQMVDVSEFDNEPAVVSLDLSRKFFNSDNFKGNIIFFVVCD